MACPEATIDFVHLPETVISGSEKVVEVEGECVANAISLYEGQNKHQCGRRGSGAEWRTWRSDRCHCKPGYQPHPIKDNTCAACPIGQFKSDPGGEECRECPPYSKGLLPGLEECPCIENYHRSRYDSATTICSRPPSSPSNLTLTKVHSTTATLTWSRPFDEGNRDDTMYRVSCETCGSWVEFDTGTEPFYQTSVSIKNLYPETSYQFLVFSLNGVSDIVEEEPEYSEIVVITTESNPVLSKRVKELEQELVDLKHELEELKKFIKLNYG